VPSPAGLVFARHILAVHALLDDMRREIGAFTDRLRGHVTIAAPRLPIVQFLARQIAEFTRPLPLVDYGRTSAAWRLLRRLSQPALRLERRLRELQRAEIDLPRHPYL
jgi:DNA-binding transcriptional LysR family regulator